MSRSIALLFGLGATLSATMIAALMYYNQSAAVAATPQRASLFFSLLVLGVALYLAAVGLILRIISCRRRVAAIA